VAQINGIVYGWEWLGNQPAHKFNEYTYTSSTLFDSVSATDALHYFLVSAHTNDPNVFYDSNIDSGYSVDNLPPSAPENVVAYYTPGLDHLSWIANSESDLKHYVVYRGASPSSLELVATVSDTIFNATPVIAGNTYWAVAAEDIHGNVSALSFPIAVTSISSEFSPVPHSFCLRQNYPNPFNPRTRISYSVSNLAHVRITIYNLLGEELVGLVDEEKMAGNYEVIWDASDFPSGMYFYRMQAGTFVETKKLVLMK
jgi:hypothetical protein